MGLSVCPVFLAIFCLSLSVSLPSPDLHAAQIAAYDNPGVDCQHLPTLFSFLLNPAYVVYFACYVYISMIFLFYMIQFLFLSLSFILSVSFFCLLYPADFQQNLSSPKLGPAQGFFVTVLT